MRVFSLDILSVGILDGISQLRYRIAIPQLPSYIKAHSHLHRTHPPPTQLGAADFIRWPVCQH